jgi:hypothetical protein
MPKGSVIYRPRDVAINRYVADCINNNSLGLISEVSSIKDESMK